MAVGSFPDDHNDQPRDKHNTEISNSNSNSDFLPGSPDEYSEYEDTFALNETPLSPPSEKRRSRLEREAKVQSRYATGDELMELRRKVSELKEDLSEARDDLDKITNGRRRVYDNYRDDEVRSEIIAAKNHISEIEASIRELNGKDPEYVLSILSERLEEMEKGFHIGSGVETREEELSKLKKEVEEAQLCIPHLNMHGLWVGKYGDHGYEMVNITYSGNTLIATKVTGDKNVPKGQISFTVDLSPSPPHQSHASQLEPIELNSVASRQWGKKFLPRHPGKGQVASEGYRNAQWMEGQLIMVGRFFSFAWVPIGHQVFFGRPSAELTLKMMRAQEEDDMKRDHVEVMRDVVERSWEETYWVERDAAVDELYYGTDGCFE